MIGIYKITSPSGKIYIGQSIDIKKRWKRYANLSGVEGQRRLYRSLKKYGFDNHNFEILIECDFEQLNELERYYQDIYNVLGENGLNCVLTESKLERKMFLKCPEKQKELQQRKIYLDTIIDDFNNKIKNKGLVKSWICKKLMISNALLSLYLSKKRIMSVDIEIKLKNILQHE